MRGASADSLAIVASQFGGVLDSAGIDPGATGQELFEVSRVLEGQGRLLRVLTDPGAGPERKAGLIGTLFGGRVSEPAVEVLTGLVRQRWSAPGDLVDAVEHLGILATLADAERRGDLERVEEELFQFARLIDGQPALSQGFDRLRGDAERRAALSESLLGGKVSEPSLGLVRQAVARVTGAKASERVMDFAQAATARRRRAMAVVTSAVPLQQDQQDRLGDILRRFYGREVQLNLEVDPSVVGGLRITVGDEVFDASVENRLEVARRRMAG